MGQDSSRISYPTRDNTPPLSPTHPAANITREMAQNNNRLPPYERQARQGTRAPSSRINSPLDTTTIDRSNALDRQEFRMAERRTARSESRKRWRGEARDLPSEEERQARRARIGSYRYYHQGGPGRVTTVYTFQDALNNWRARRGPMTPIRGRRSRYLSGSRTMHRQEQKPRAHF